MNAIPASQSKPDHVNPRPASRPHPGATAPDAATALVVDDDLRSRELLTALLTAQGYRVTQAADGAEALAAAARQAPDVVLLDVMMPVMDGFETCRRLKQQPQTAIVPVLLVTALNDRAQRLNGIAAGALDFLSKPIDHEDVLLRIRNAVATKRLHDQLGQELARVQELEALKANLTHFIVHDLRSPLVALQGGLQLMAEDTPPGHDSMTYINCALSATKELIEMVSSILDVERLETRQLPLRYEPCDLLDLAGRVLEQLAPVSLAHKVQTHADGAHVTARADRRLIERTLTNLAINAIKFSPADSLVRLDIARVAERARVSVRDAGPGIPPEFQQLIFEKFGQVESRASHQKYSSGLGLTFCRLAVEAHGGGIGVVNLPTGGSEFWFEIPLGQPG